MKQKEKNVEIYVSNLLVKSKSPVQQIQNLEETFATLKRYNMRLNPLKFIVGVGIGKFLGFLLPLKA